MTHAAKPAARPLSPHLQVYRLPLAALTSIFHRITGIGLTLGIPLLVWWVASAAYGSEAYAARPDLSTRPWLPVAFGFSVALFFHLCNGIRHLFWDAGMNFEVAETKRTNVMVIVATIALTVVSWFLALV